MRKFINGKYVAVTQDKVEAKKKDAPAKGAATAPAGKPAGVNVDISAGALKLMQAQPAGLDWSGLAGSGRNGQITKPDVEKFLKG